MSGRRRSLPGSRSFALVTALTIVLAAPIAGTATSQDATPPTVTITAPGAGATIEGVVRVAGRAKDRGGVADVKISVDGGRVGIATGTAAWSFELDPAGLADGAHTIAAEGTDRKGNIGAASVDVIVRLPQVTDSIAPAVTIDTPEAGSVLSGTVSFSGTAADEGDVVGLELQVDSDAPTAIAPASSWSSTVDTALLSDGTHAVAVRATDQAGNVGTGSRSFVVENGDGGGTPSPSPEPTPDPTDGSGSGPSPTPCSGVTVRTGDDLQAKVNANPGGTTFCLLTGVHHIPAGVLAKADDTFIGETGAVLDGGGVADRGIHGYGGATAQHDVRISNLIFEDFTVEAIKAGWGWTITDSEVRSSRSGIRVNTGTVLRRTFIHHNFTYGVVGGPSSDVLIEGNELALNGGTSDSGGSTGGSKIAGSSAGAYRIVWRGNYVHDNRGPGIWSDGNVHDVLYEDNRVIDNLGPGIFHEISWDATIRSNVVRGNAIQAIGKSCWWGSQIHVNNSQHVLIVDNITGSAAGANGICLVDATRPQTSPFPTYLADIDVRGNASTLHGSAMTGLVGKAARGITFDRNTYLVPDLVGKYWSWYDRYPISWAEFRTRAGEADGSRILSSG